MFVFALFVHATIGPAPASPPVPPVPLPGLKLAQPTGPIARRRTKAVESKRMTKQPAPDPRAGASIDSSCIRRANACSRVFTGFSPQAAHLLRPTEAQAQGLRGLRGLLIRLLIPTWDGC